MGAFADSLFAVLMSWVRALVNGLWGLLSTERTSLLEFLGKHWLLIVIVLVAAGLLIDWIIWLIRWRPYTLWAQRMRRLLRISPQDEDMDEEMEPPQRPAPAVQAVQEEEEEEDMDWLPERPVFDKAQEQQAMERAQSVPDEELGLYPGMRYDERASQSEEDAELGGTQRYAAVPSVRREGPGAAEVSRRREEINAYNRQLEEEARLERERRMEALRRAQQMRLAEEERMAQEARRAEEERAAQADYARRMAEYERQKAQYELEMAQYQRDMAAYEAAIAAQNTQEKAPAPMDAEAAQELAPQSGGRTRTRRRPATYSDMVQGETVKTLPETPNWPQMDKTVSQVKKSAAKKAPEKKTPEKKAPEKKNRLVMGMAKLMEPDQEEIMGVNALPPRVDPKAAYKPAAKPASPQKRHRK